MTSFQVMNPELSRYLLCVARSNRLPLSSFCAAIKGEGFMSARTTVHSLQVDSALHRFIETQVLPGTGVDAAAFWKGFDAIVRDLAPKNIALLAERDRLQA